MKSKKPRKIKDSYSVEELATLLGLPDAEDVIERNQHNIHSASDGIDDEEERFQAEQDAQDEVFNLWASGVDHAANVLFGNHGLELTNPKDNRYMYKIVPSKSWDDAANKIKETINGVGMFHFSSLREFLDSGPYTAREAVLTHLGYIKRYPEVYGDASARTLYSR